MLIIQAGQNLNQVLEPWHKNQQDVIQVKVETEKKSKSEVLYAELQLKDGTKQWQRVDEAMSVKCSKSFDLIHSIFIASVGTLCFNFISHQFAWLQLQGKRLKK